MGGNPAGVVLRRGRIEGGVAGARVGTSRSAPLRRRTTGERGGQGGAVGAAELGKLGWPDAELAQRRKGEIGKVRIARRLRRETTMALKWIAERLQMGGWTYVLNLLKGHGPGAEPGRQRKSIKSED